MKNKRIALRPLCGALAVSMLALAGCTEQPPLVDPFSSSEVTTSPETAPVPDTFTVTAEDAGLDIYAVRTYSEDIKASVVGGEVKIEAVREGKGTVEIFNSYAESASAEVEVDSNLRLSVYVRKFEAPENVFNAGDFGAKNGADVTAALQACIDKAHASGSGTVYLPLGSYRIGTLSLKSGVTLRLEGFIPDARVGYDAEVKKTVSSGKITTITTNGSSRSNFFMLNTPLPQAYCTEGTSDFTVSGGLWDAQAKMKFSCVACGNNIVFENLLIKDNPNNHAFQIEGCSNVTLRNIMFAGYNYPASDPVLTRETIQLEPTTSGAIGSNYDTNAIQCKEGDYHHCSNVEVTGCYFGKSDKYGPQLTPVGHHSASGSLVCNVFSFTNNVVDNPLYCGLHLPNYLNVEISGNKFISTSAGTKASLGTDSALISLYGFTSDNKYTTDDGKTVYYAFSYEHPGIQHFDIHDNEFTVGGKTHVRVMYVAGANNDYNGAKYVSNSSAYKCESYGGPLRKVNEYLLTTNCAADIRIHDNKITFESAPAFKGYYSFFKYICGFTYENNEVTLSPDCSFTSAYEGITGVKSGGIAVGNEEYTRKITISRSASKTVTVITDGNGITVQKPSSTTALLTFRSDGGGKIAVDTDGSGNLKITVLPFEGYRFTGFTDKDGKPADVSAAVRDSAVYIATFGKAS